MNNISENIARIMKVKGITQKELAGSLNVSQQTVCKWKYGSSPRTALSRIAEALDVSVGELVALNGDVAGSEDHELSKIALHMAREFDSLSAAAKLFVMEVILQEKEAK